jgi:2,4-dienoyl-CoA reductase-like NADH-dependent reductase (Old Yellow Enzyme family)/NADPH-dependent 2,4-dienoyl-CoA reductase/sulfur reductase-like enzyme
MYENLFSPVRIGRLEVKNRVAMTAIGANLGAAGGGVNEDIIAFYEARARGGVGLIVSGICRVMDNAGAGEPCQLAARSHGDVQGLARLMDAVHKYGAKMFLQLQHPGCTYFLGEAQAVSASAIVPPGGIAARALTISEIEQIIQAFVRGAIGAQMAGVDGVELHGAHGYLINSFLSPYLNKRDDRYGGSFDNRMRFVLEIIEGIRAACGKAFPLGVRISADEFVGDKGNDLAAGCQIAVALERAGVDFLDVSSTLGGANPDCLACIEPGTYGQGWKKYMAAEIKKHVRIPVIAVANIKEPEVAEAILAEGCCDLVGVARGHLADPAWCNKARVGVAETITKCIGCLACFYELEHARHVKCAVNPKTGREREFAEPKRNGAGRKVAVIGGGPAGFTAAMLLHERGFHPVLFESSHRLGGALNVADKAPARDKITRFVDSMIAQAEERGLDIRLGEAATVEKVQALSPCGVFIACGAQPFVPPVPGVDGRNVFTAESVLLGQAEIRGEVVVVGAGQEAAERPASAPKTRPDPWRAEVIGDCLVVGSGMTGLETAEAVLMAGHKATVADMLPQIGAGADVTTILDLRQRMDPFKPTYLPSHKLLRITPEGVDLQSLESGAPVFVPAETVILAMGVRPRQNVVDAFKTAFPEARVIGDAVRGGRIIDATQDAYGQAFVFEP